MSFSMQVDQARRDLLALCRIRGVAWDLLAREAQRPDGLARLLSGKVSETTRAGERTRTALGEGLEDLHQHYAFVDEQLGLAQEAGAHLFTVLDDDYPTNLRLIYNLPPFIFVLGDLTSDDEHAAAVVGTRHPQAEAVDLAADMACALGQHDVTIVSGMAAGIDTAAHRAALDSGGRTIAVMGTGILRRYPKQNAELADQIAEHGALVSQFWPTTPPSKYNFPRRNVVTSGISQGTIVIEATETSGAKMQARLAVEHGKNVFLVRSLVTSQPWAAEYLRTRPRVFEVDGVDDVLRRLQAGPEITALREQRSQLAFDFA